MNALLAAPYRTTWAGRSDHAILSVALQTGLRVPEITNLRRCDIVTSTGAHIRCEGKGRKQRCTPLRQKVAKVLDVWLKERAGLDDDPLFPTIRGTKLSRDAMERLVHKHTLAASKSCASLTGKRISPHILRHSTAMELLHHADLRLKEKFSPESRPLSPKLDGIAQMTHYSPSWKPYNYAELPHWNVRDSWSRTFWHNPKVTLWVSPCR